MNQTMTDENWIDLFIIELRVRGVRGAAIGDAVASVREFVADSGQTAEDAFGPARDYAASLDLPATDPRRQMLQSIVLPVLGLLAFLVFSTATTAWFAGDPVRVSAAQVAFLAVPVFLSALFAFPSYLRAALEKRWLLVVLVLVAGVSGVLAALLAPSSSADAWLTVPPLPVLLGAMAVMIALSVVGTVVVLRSHDDDEITDPLEAAGAAKPAGRWRAFVLLTNWLFPILAVLIFAMAGGFTFLRS